MNRRKLAGTAAAAALAGMLLSGAASAAEVAPITIVINQSPWFEGFRKTVELYEQQTGNTVNLDVNPFAGSLEKQRNSVRAKEGLYDILIMNSGWYAEMYAGGFVAPITDIDPDFKLDPQVYPVDNTMYWDAKTKTSDPETGKLMSMSIAPLIPLLYYRRDLYEEKGLKAPETWDELLANAKLFHDPPRMYGMVQRGARGPHTVAYDFYPYLYGHGGSIFKDQNKGDYTVTLNNAEGKAALDYYLQLAREAGHPKTAALDQAEVIQNMVTGKAAHVMMVIAAWSQMDDPTKSIVVGKVALAPPPHAPGLNTAPGLGHWLGGISHNVPVERQKAAVEFFRWFQKPESQIASAELGMVPVSAAAYEAPISKEPRFSWMEAMKEALPHAVNIYNFPEANEVIPVLEVELNRAIAGEISSTDALNSMADQIHAVMSKYGYKTGKLPPL